MGCYQLASNSVVMKMFSMYNANLKLDFPIELLRFMTFPNVTAFEPLSQFRFDLRTRTSIVNNLYLVSKYLEEGKFCHGDGIEVAVECSC